MIGFPGERAGASSTAAMAFRDWRSKSDSDCFKSRRRLEAKILVLRPVARMMRTSSDAVGSRGPIEWSWISRSTDKSTPS
jgi:hypothetical protein